MTRDSLGWFVAGAMGVLACTLGAVQQQRGDVGRYQLVEGRYQIVGNGAATEAVTVWRIDTVTGDTSRFTATTEGGKYREWWTSKVPDLWIDRGQP